MRSNFKMENKNITMVKGDTLAFGIEIEGLDQDLDTAYFTCKKSYTDPDMFRKSLGHGITKVDTGQYAVRVAPADTKDLEAGRYYYDLEIGANGDIFTIMKGVLEIEQDTTF